MNCYSVYSERLKNSTQRRKVLVGAAALIALAGVPLSIYSFVDQEPIATLLTLIVIGVITALAVNVVRITQYGEFLAVEKYQR